MHWIVKEKERVKDKIIKMCEAREIKIPDFNNYSDVKKTVEAIKNTCPFCKKRVWHSTAVICSCEIKNDWYENDYLWK